MGGPPTKRRLAGNKISENYFLKTSFAVVIPVIREGREMAQVDGLEPPTKRLTAACSTN